jgi:AAA domain
MMPALKKQSPQFIGEPILPEQECPSSDFPKSRNYIYKDRAGNPAYHVKVRVDKNGNSWEDLEPIPEGLSREGFHLTPISELQSRPASWLIKGFLERNSLNMLFGPPGCGKSFLAIDAACSIASKAAFHELEVRDSGPVIYIAGEGLAGLQRRFLAWSIEHDIPLENLPILISSGPTQLCDWLEFPTLKKTIESAAEEFGPPRLIIFDTLNRNAGPGDENSSKDMTDLIASCDQIKSLYGSSILLVHHSGLQFQERARGSSVLNGALDSAFRMDLDTEGVIRLECTKMKEAEPPPPMAYILGPVFLGFNDEDGGQVFSACLESTSYQPPAKAGSRGRGKWQTVAQSVFEDLLTEHRKNLESGGFDPETARISVQNWWLGCKKKGMPKQRFFEIKKAPESLGLEIQNGFVS